MDEENKVAVEEAVKEAVDNINDYEFEQLVKDEIKSRVNEKINDSGLTGDNAMRFAINNQIKKSTEKYIDEYVKGEVYNLLKTGRLNVLVKELAPKIITEALISSIYGAVKESLTIRQQNPDFNISKDVENTIKEKLE
jgi:hypothetical protein